MGTPYQIIYERFWPFVSEYAALSLTDDERDELLYPYLMRAANQFRSICVEDLDDRNDAIDAFNADLSDEEIDILIDFMVVNWLKHKLYNSDILRNGMSTKDYTVFSPANLQAQIRETYDDAYNRAQERLYHYSYTHPKEPIADKHL